MHLSEEHPDGIIILAIMQQEEACIARRDIGRDKEVVESINSLQGFTHIQDKQQYTPAIEANISRELPCNATVTLVTQPHISAQFVLGAG